MFALDPEDVRNSEARVRASYDRVPYPSLPHHLAHPDRLATLAILYGLEPPQLERCRVLELGCSDGGHLIPLAFASPGGRFVGIDLSPRQIGDGLSLVDACGLSNVELLAMSLLDVGPGLGEFDYIIAHGLFSWVGETARGKILDICRDNLAANGVAFVSYNTLPGWHFRRVLRDLMRYHSRQIEDPLRRTEAAVELIRFLGASVLEKDDAYGRFLDWCTRHLADHEERPSYLVHEYLEQDNVPLYFHQFVDLAADHGLQYLGEADCRQIAVENLPESLGEDLQRLGGDRIGIEQYIDFLRNRSFRQSLLCHVGLDVDRALVSNRLRRLYVSSSARPEPPDDGGDSQACSRFRLPDGTAFSTAHPMAREVLRRLSESWPAALSFDRLHGDVIRRLRQAAATDKEVPEEGGVETLADILWTTFFGGVLDLHVRRPPIATTVGDRPAASPLARCQAARGPLVTNLWHRPINLGEDEVARLLLAQADGRHDRAALVRQLEEEVRTGRLQLRLDEKPVEENAPRALLLDRLVESRLQQMAEWALLTT